MDNNLAICEMFSSDIKAELSARQFELLDPTLDSSYRRWVCDRVEALMYELNSREMQF